MQSSGVGKQSAVNVIIGPMRFPGAYSSPCDCVRACARVHVRAEGCVLFVYLLLTYLFINFCKEFVFVPQHSRVKANPPKKVYHERVEFNFCFVFF